MSFDAVKLIEKVSFEIYFGLLILEDPLIEINGNEGHVCDTESTVDHYTADLLCKKAGYLTGYDEFL